MSRKTSTCHICGEETDRFAEHISSKHKLYDHKREKVARDQKQRFILWNSFTYESDLRNNLNLISGSTDGMYTFENVNDFLRSKGWVVKKDENEITATLTSNLEERSAAEGRAPLSPCISKDFATDLTASDTSSPRMRSAAEGRVPSLSSISIDFATEVIPSNTSTREARSAAEGRAPSSPSISNDDDGDNRTIIMQYDEEGEQDVESEDDGMTWETMRYNEGDTIEDSPQSKIYKRSYYVGRSTVGAARKARQTVGLDDKFPLTEPLLLGFHAYLQSTTAAVTNTNNMVSQISKLLKYLSQVNSQQGSPTINTIADVSNLTKYYNILESEVGMKASSMKNQYHALEHYISFLTTSKGVSSVRHPQLRSTLDIITGLLTVFKKKAMKKISKERNQKTTRNLQEGIPFNLNEMKEQYEDANLIKKVNELMNDYKEKRCHNVKDYNVFMRYLMSVIIFGHFQRPCVVANMKVREFVHGKRATDGRIVILVSDHKTDSSGPAQVALEEGHYQQFQQYMRRFRPASTSTGAEIDAKFFVRLNGKEIKNPTKELDLLQTEFKLTSVTSSNARHVLETAKGNANLDADTRAGISKYLRHSEATSDKHYDFSLIEASAKNREAIVNLTKGTAADLTAATATDTESLVSEHSHSSIDADMTTAQLKDILYEKLVENKRVNVHGKAPTMTDVRNLFNMVKHVKSADESFKATAPRIIMSRWRDEQKRMRAAFVADGLKIRPSAEDLAHQIENDYKWSQSASIAKKALVIFKTPTKRKTAAVAYLTIDQTDAVSAAAADQSWELEIIHNLPERGRGVVAVKELAANEVVCDYGGKLLSHKIGQEIYEKSSDLAMGFMFKFSYKGRKYYSDATEDIPGQAGRLINDSKCCANTKAVPLQLTNGEPHLFFIAKRNIALGEEILFDYNDNESKADFLKQCPICDGMGTVATNVDMAIRAAVCSSSAASSSRRDNIEEIALLPDSSEAERVLLYANFCKVSVELAHTTRSQVENWIQGIHTNNVDYIIKRRHEAVTKNIRSNIATHAGAKRQSKRFKKL